VLRAKENLLRSIVMNIVIPALLLVVVSRIPAFVPAVLTAQCSPLSRIEAWMALALDLSIRKGDGNLGN
jgi:hypothetical protein